MSEHELVARAATTQDVAAFGALVRQHQSKVRSFLRRMTRGDHALADDLAQETFVEAWRKVAQFRGEGTFLSWLFQIAYSRFLMEARRKKLEPLGEEDIAGEDRTETATLAKLDLERAMAKLSVAERGAVTLCCALGYTDGEAARILDLPLGSVKSHILRGREKLRALLAGWQETDSAVG